MRVVRLVCPGGLGVGWCGVAGPGSRPGRRALMAGTLAGLWPVLVFLAWCVLGAADPPCPRGGDGERVCQGCATLRHASRPLTYARWSAGSIGAAVVSLGAARWAS